MKAAARRQRANKNVVVDVEDHIYFRLAKSGLPVRFECTSGKVGNVSVVKISMFLTF